MTLLYLLQRKKYCWSPTCRSDIGALEKFILNQFSPIPGIEKIRSSFALKQVRYKTALPLR